MGRPDVDGLNTGYAALLLEQYLDNPGAVPEEWRDLFESEPEVLLQRQPGLARLLERAAATADGDGHAPPVAPPTESTAAPVPGVAEEDKELLGAIAAALILETLNIVRIVSLFYLSRWDAAWFEWAHLYLWQPLIMVDVLVVWLVWLRWARGSPRAA